MRKILPALFILLLAITWSCKKDHTDPLPGYPLSFRSYQVSGPRIKVYTNGGEIDIPLIKDRVIKRHKHNLSDLGNMNVDKKIAVTFLSEDSVLMTLDEQKEEKTRLVRRTADEYVIWEKQDTAAVPVYFFNMMNVTALLPLYYEEIQVPQVTGYNKVARYKECFFAKKTNQGFQVPVFDFVYIDEYGTFPRLGINNRFNENCLTTIDSNDTILIQEYFVDLKEVKEF